MRKFHLQWCQVPIWLAKQYVKLNTIQAINLANINVLVWADTFAILSKYKNGIEIPILTTIYEMK